LSVPEAQNAFVDLHRRGRVNIDVALGERVLHGRLVSLRSWRTSIGQHASETRFSRKRERGRRGGAAEERGKCGRTRCSSRVRVARIAGALLKCRANRRRTRRRREARGHAILARLHADACRLKRSLRGSRDLARSRPPPPTTAFRLLSTIIFNARVISIASAGVPCTSSRVC